MQGTEQMLSKRKANTCRCWCFMAAAIAAAPAVWSWLPAVSLIGRHL